MENIRGEAPIGLFGRVRISSRSMASAPPLQHHRRSPYAVLNLPQQQQSSAAVCDNRIRDSYKRLSRLFHPDKHPPGKQRDDAQELFIELYYACKNDTCGSCVDYVHHAVCMSCFEMIPL
jgi:hypothetical protein